jgi:hypothetical protein
MIYSVIRCLLKLSEVNTTSVIDIDFQASTIDGAICRAVKCVGDYGSNIPHHFLRGPDQGRLF